MTVDIGTVIAAALPTMRAHAESLHASTCTIERLTTAWDEAQQKSVTTWVTVYADLPCHLEEPSVTSASMLTAEAVTLENPLVSASWTTDGVLPDDRVTFPGREPMWVTRAAHDDSTHPVEYLIQCRWTR